MWPEDEMRLDGQNIIARWGVLLNRKGNLWSNRGYSGGRDSVSYEVDDGKINFTVAANARFIVRGGAVLDNRRNATRRVHL